MTIEIMDSTQKQDNAHAKVYKVTVSGVPRIAVSPRDLLLEVARAYSIDVKNLELR